MQVDLAFGFYMYSVSTQVMADDLTVPCEHINHELWLYITADLLIQCELKNNIYKIVQCMPSFRYSFKDDRVKLKQLREESYLHIASRWN